MMFSLLLLASVADARLARTDFRSQASSRATVLRHPISRFSLVHRPRPATPRDVLSSASWIGKASEALGFRSGSPERRSIDKSELTVVTGGGSGIGRAAALRLAKRGLSVMIVGRRGGALEDTKKMAEESGFEGEIIPVIADVTSEEGRQTVADAVQKLSGQGVTLRGLVHNAAVNTPCKKMMDLTPEDWIKVSDINVNGPLFLTQKLYPLFGKTETEKNRILMLSSVARTCSGLPAYGPYCVSKLTFYGMHLMFKEELGKESTPVYSASLIPGEVDTEMQRQTAYGQPDGTFPENLVKYWREIQESGQLLPPEVTGAFMEYVMLDTAPEDYQKDEWFIYDKKHHKDWAYEFPDVKIEEPAGLF